jgi:hypothetical protein
MSGAHNLVRRFDETPWVGSTGDARMSVQDQIDKYIAGQSSAKREELQELHQLVLSVSPDCKLWFLDGKNEEGKIVTNENIGYGSQTIEYATGKTREFYRIGVSANATGISVYLIGIKDKRYLSETYGQKLGRANITGCCIKFRSIRDIDTDVLEEIVADHIGVARGL